MPGLLHKEIRKLLFFSWALSLISIAAVWACFYVERMTSEQSHGRGIQREVTRLAHAFQEHSARTFAQADQIAHLMRSYRKDGTPPDLGLVATKLALDPKVFNLLAMMDANGDIVASSQSFAPANYRDREHVKVHINSKVDRAFISKPLLGRISGKWAVQLTRPMHDSRGEFVGVAVVSVDPEYFTDFYSKSKMGPRCTIALFGEDGVIRAGIVGKQKRGMGANIAGTDLFEGAVGFGSAGGFLLARDIDDGRVRAHGIRKLEHLPLYVAVGFDWEDNQAGYRAERNRMIAFAIGFSVFILVTMLSLTIWIYRRPKVRERERPT